MGTGSSPATRRGDGWRPRPLRWVAESRGSWTPDEPGAPPITWPYGLDAGGRVRVARMGPSGGMAVVYRETFHDLLWFARNGGRGGDGPRLPVIPERARESGVPAYPRGRMIRLLKDADGRIIASVKLNNGWEKPRTHFRTLRRFEYDADGRYVGETERWFARGLDDRGSENREWNPEIAPGYFESVYMRRRVRARYDAAGRLAEVIAYDHDPRRSRVQEQILYGYNPGDTVPKLVGQLSALLAKQLPKAVLAALKANPAAKPLARVALVYSAEHAHCGLPSRVLLAGEADRRRGSVRTRSWKKRTRTRPRGRPPAAPAKSGTTCSAGCCWPSRATRRTTTRSSPARTARSYGKPGPRRTRRWPRSGRRPRTSPCSR